MPERLFLFLQLEFPWELGPPDGRYLLRAAANGEPEHVVVLATLGAKRRVRARGAGWSLLGRSGSRGAVAPSEPEPAAVATTRATIVDPVPLSAQRQAQAWLGDLDTEREALAAVGALNRLVHSHRIAAADPYVHELSPAQALVIRAGWGEGEQVADGLWLYARELPWKAGRARGAGVRRRASRDRTAVLRPQERLAELLSGRGAALLCEDLVLRARADLDHGRLAHAAVELDAAYAAALQELPAEKRRDLAIRVAELEQLQGPLSAQARSVLAAAPRASSPGGEAKSAPASGDRVEAPGEPAAIDEEAVRHALERLEAALRARTAPGF